ncbi:MAG: hypothetical protein JWM28_2593, partial [Chitinophagaceae bacterium]|nr:hypothetical protein [Chitinophagaceae bacterium]
MFEIKNWFKLSPSIPTVNFLNITVQSKATIMNN